MNTLEEEAILIDEPIDSTYTIIYPNKLSLFPYNLIGIIRLLYINTSDREEISEGVGTLIGDNIVLTTAHNLYNIQIKRIIIIEFIPLINGKIKLIEPIKCTSYYIPKAVIELKNSGDDNILAYDYGICFWESNLGSALISMFQLEHDGNFAFQEIVCDNGDKRKIFSFFFNQVLYAKEVVNALKKGTIDVKMSMISYVDIQDNDIYEMNNKYTTLKNVELTRELKGSTVKQCVDDRCFYIFGKDKQEEIFFSNENNKVICENRGRLCTLQSMNRPSKTETWRGSYIESKNIILNDTPTNWSNIKTVNTTTSSASPTQDPSKASLRNRDNYELDYMITTLCGQSGSPIFMRIKQKPQNKTAKYLYRFIGIHSRSSNILLSSTNTAFSFFNIGLLLNTEIHNDIITIITKDKTCSILNPKKIGHLSGLYLLLTVKYYSQKVIFGIFPITFLLDNLIKTLAHQYFFIEEDFVFLCFHNWLFFHDYCKRNKTTLEAILKNSKTQEQSYSIELEVGFDINEIAKVKGEKIVEKGKENKILFNSTHMSDEILYRSLISIENELKRVYQGNKFLYSQLYFQVQTYVLRKIEKVYKYKEQEKGRARDK